MNDFFYSTFEDRKQEINKYIELMKLLENKHNEDNGDADGFYDVLENQIGLSYSEFINIMKSNCSLMLYNVIEYAVAAAMDQIYDEIRRENLSYEELAKPIRAVWRKTMMKADRDPNASMNSILKQSEQIIDAILSKKTIELASRDVMPGGNLDAEAIRKLLMDHGISAHGKVFFEREDILLGIKKSRNELAHGAVSFSDAVRDMSLSDIENQKNYVYCFLDATAELLNVYINDGKYRISRM